MKDIFLSVVIPCFDEMANLQKGVLDKIEHFLDKKKFSYEVIIVDDGSADGSKEFLDEFVSENKKFTLIKNSHTGKAGAVTTGVLSAKGKYILFADMDQATPIEEVDKLLPYLEEGYDVVIGSRSKKRKGSPFIRRFISQSQIVLRKTIVGIGDIIDTQCGFKAFKNKAGKTLFEKLYKLHDGFHVVSGSNVTSGFDVEVLYLAEKMGYKIKEVPVNWLYVETRRVNPLKDSIEGVMDLIKIKTKDIRGDYN